MRKHCLISCLAVVLALATAAMAAEDPDEARVMLLGVFHFANPGKDAVKSEVIDVMTPENQAYLEALSERIAAGFQPTAVLLEYDRQEDSLINERYRDYLAGEYELGVNEIYQLGFRIAAKAGLERVYSFDEREVHWNAGPLFERLEQQPERKAEVDRLIESIGEEMTRKHRTLSLADLLRSHNDGETDRRNRGLYLTTNDIGAGDGFEGADAAASWWHRNFRMYANIQQHATPGSRVVAIGGQGHTAILKELLADDPDRVAVPVQEFF